MGTDSRLQSLVADYERGLRRRQIALKLHESGKTMDQIGSRLGVSKQRASQLVAKAKAERQDEGAGR